MCKDQNLISETNEGPNEGPNERMKIEKPGVGRPLLGPAIISYMKLTFVVYISGPSIFKCCPNQKAF